MKHFEIVYLGDVQAKQRPKFNRKTGVAYTPRNTNVFESTLRMLAQNHLAEQGFTPIEVACKVNIFVFKSVPTSWSKKKQIEHIRQQLPVTSKPDLDNCAKSILDALNGVFFVDDKLVAELSVKKAYSTLSHVKVECEEL